MSIQADQQADAASCHAINSLCRKDNAVIQRGARRPALPHTRQLSVFDGVSDQTKQPIKGHGQYSR